MARSGQNLDNRYDSSFPGSFFSSLELNNLYPALFGGLDEVWARLEEEQSLPLSDAHSTNDLRASTAVSKLYFRGQSIHGYGLSSSLHRLLGRESQDSITEELLGTVEGRILEEAKKHGLAKNISPGEVLMLLQHHQAPTRLLDVSVKPLEALYFAVEKDDARDGRLFILWLNQQEPMELAGRPDLPWTEFVRAGGKAVGEWTQSVRPIEERPLDPRMIAQQGRFLVGGVQRAYANLNIWFDRQLRISERQAISMFPIGFMKSPQANNSETRWPSLGWTIRIPHEWKPELRSRLEALDISHDSMYPDLGNIAWRSERAARRSGP